MKHAGNYIVVIEAIYTLMYWQDYFASNSNTKLDLHTSLMGISETILLGHGWTLAKEVMRWGWTHNLVWHLTRRAHLHSQRVAVLINPFMKFYKLASKTSKVMYSCISVRRLIFRTSYKIWDPLQNENVGFPVQKSKGWGEKCCLKNANVKLSPFFSSVSPVCHDVVIFST